MSKSVHPPPNPLINCAHILPGGYKIGATCPKAYESASFHLLFFGNQNQDLSFLADTRKYRGVAINSTRLAWVLTKDIATAIK